MVINSEQQRAALKVAGNEMLDLCQSQLAIAKEAFINNDSELAEEVINNDSRYNAVDLKIDKVCDRFVAY